MKFAYVHAYETYARSINYTTSGTRAVNALAPGPVDEHFLPIHEAHLATASSCIYVHRVPQNQLLSLTLSREIVTEVTAPFVSSHSEILA